MAKMLPVAFWLLTLSAFGAEPKWIHVPSADFEIFSSAGEADTRRVLQHFERVRSFFDSLPSSTSKQQAPPVRVIVFGAKKEYDLYRPNDFAVAFYTQIAGRDYIVFGGVSDDVFPTAVHEYVHLVVQHTGLTLPPWLNEGMAELFSTLKPQGDKVIVGNIIPGRIYEMSQQKWVPLATILAAGSDSPYYNEKNKAGSLYNEGWALTHMLELSPEYGPRFRDLVAQIATGAPSQSAIEKVYGKPLAAVEKDLQAYLRLDTFNGRIVSAKLNAGMKAAVEPAQMFDVKLTLLDLSNRPGKEAETRQKLTELVSEYPTRPEPQSDLGYLAWRTGQKDQAVKAFSSAFQLGDRNQRMLWDYGRLAANSDPANAILALGALLESQPGRVDVRLVLAGIQLSRRQAKEALQTLTPVKSVTSADAPRLFELLAFARRDSGDLTGARADAIRWQASAKEPADSEQASRFLKSLDGTTQNSTTKMAMTMMPPSVSAPMPDDGQDAGPPRLAHSETLASTDSRTAGTALPSIQGSFEELDCSGTTPKLVLLTGAGKVALLMDQPDKVIISGLKTASVDMNCGRQKSAPVSIQYEPAPATQSGVKGSVRVIEFDPENQR
jgi:tetratricopeptide (TPR) repeat protein